MLKDHLSFRQQHVALATKSCFNRCDMLSLRSKASYNLLTQLCCRYGFFVGWFILSLCHHRAFPRGKSGALPLMTPEHLAVWHIFKLNTSYTHNFYIHKPTNIRVFLYQENGKTGYYFFFFFLNYSIGDFSELLPWRKQFKHLQHIFLCQKNLKNRVFSRKISWLYSFHSLYCLILPC